MSQEHIFAAMLSMISIFLLWLMAFWLYRDYCVDAFRHEMFKLRDQLFDEAAGGMISFDHPAYGLLRRALNGNIRFAHRYSISQVGIQQWLTRDESEPISFSQRLRELSEDLDFTARNRLLDYSNQMNALILRHLLLSSPVLLITLVFPMIAWLASRYCLNQLLEWFRDPIDQIDSAAVAQGYVAV